MVLACFTYADSCRVDVAANFYKWVECHNKKIKKIKCPGSDYSIKDRSETKWKVWCDNYVFYCKCDVYI